MRYVNKQTRLLSNRFHEPGLMKCNNDFQTTYSTTINIDILCEIQQMNMSYLYDDDDVIQKFSIFVYCIERTWIQ